MINLNYNLTNSATNIAVNSINDSQAKMAQAAQKVASGDVNVVEQMLQNQNYTQQVQAASKVVETETKAVGTLIDIKV